MIHLPTDTGGNPAGIGRSLKKMGIRSEVWVYSASYLNYSRDKEIFRPEDATLIRELKRLWALRYVFRFKVVFFNFGTTLFAPFPLCSEGLPWFKTIFLRFFNMYLVAFQYLELTLLRLLGRKILVQYQGDDARQGDYSLKNFEVSIAGQVDRSYYPSESDTLKRQQIRLLDRFCHRIYALNPDLLHVLPTRAEFLPYSHISLEDWIPVYMQFEDRPLRVAHAPTHRGVKGTIYIIEAVAALKEEGYIFDFILVEGLSNQEAREIYKTVDVFVDQVFAGWYGGVAVELMALGKPVMVYIREGDLGFIPREMADELPIIGITLRTLKESLRAVLELPRERLFDIGKKSRTYVERWHNPEVISKRILRDLLETTD
jgi:hypothetical protein